MFEEELQPAAPATAQPGLLTRQHAVNLGYPEDAFEPAEEIQPTSPAGRRPRALLTRQNAVNLGYPDGVPKPGSSSLAQTAADPAGKTVPTHHYGYKAAQEEPVAGLVFRDMYAAGVDNALAKDDIQVVEPVVGVFSSGPAPIDAEAAARRRRAEQLIKEHGMQPLRRQSHIFLENQRRLQQQGLLSPHHAEELDVFAPAADSPGPSTAPRPRPGCELKRHHAVYIERTSSQNGLSLLSSPRKGKAIPFSRQGSEAPLGSEASSHSQHDSLPSISESAEPARVDKGKGRALPEPEPEPQHQNAPVDKGKKRAREEDDDEGSSESSAGSLDEVEASLVIDLEDDEEDNDDGEEQMFPSDWPRNYVLRKSLFRVEVSMIPMPYLPIAPVPSDGEPALKYIGPQGTQPPTILTSGSKRARDEDEAAEDIAPRAKKARMASE
ncbi:hypothetical protein OH76DRAFT_932274 [Lentinus brumalis]|uniref:Uncharacterized protein n=1 Tax=Lentinus brumalis TaxID=2498619 RepID=A0A371CZP8_9APHY|nr:hypothetical protein OH76DRAFT_932274 [Polyporus brumalis]